MNFVVIFLAIFIFISCSSNSTPNIESPHSSSIEQKEREDNRCLDLLKNSNFDTNLDGWIVDGEGDIVDDGYNNSKAISIKNATLSQISKEIYEVDSFQFEGYYKMRADTNLTISMQFLDNNKDTIFKKEALYKSSKTFQHFLLNATSTKSTKYIAVSIKTSNGTDSVVLDNLELKNSSCYNYQIASSLPPNKILPKDAPQFIVLGFDDNTRSEGINWILDLLKSKKNRDNSPIITSFYLNTIGLKSYIEDNPKNLLTALERIVALNHEIGNHTDNHNPRLNGENYEDFEKRINSLSYEQWKKRVDNATNDILSYLKVERSKIVGFRTPYLLYNQNSFLVLKDENFLYDCSIEDGYAPEIDGTNFRWPYQLNQGSPGHNENWRGKQSNDNYIKLPNLDGLWELPSYPLIIPDDNESLKYNIQIGLWDRLVSKIPYLKGSDHKITGLDYNLWSEGELNKSEVLGILKYNLDLRLKGNHAPFMIGLHTQYYTKEWADNNAPNATYIEMREAIEEFIDYALTKEKVHFTSSQNIIKWCQEQIR